MKVGGGGGEKGMRTKLFVMRKRKKARVNGEDGWQVGEERKRERELDLLRGREIISEVGGGKRESKMNTGGGEINVKIGERKKF